MIRLVRVLTWLGLVGCGGVGPDERGSEDAQAHTVPVRPLRVLAYADLPEEARDVVAEGAYSRGSFRGAVRPDPNLVLADGARVRLDGSLPSPRWLGRRLRLEGRWEPDPALGRAEGTLRLTGGAQDVLPADPSGLMLRDATARLPEHLTQRGYRAVWPPLDGAIGDRGHGAFYLAVDADGAVAVFRVATDGEAMAPLGNAGEVRDVVGVLDDEGLHLDLAVRLVDAGATTWRVLRDRDGTLQRVQAREEQLAEVYDRAGLFRALAAQAPSPVDPLRLVEIARSCSSTQVPEDALHFTSSTISRGESGGWAVRLQSEEGREIRIVVQDDPPRCNNLRRPVGPMPTLDEARAAIWSRALACAVAEPYVGTDRSGAPLLLDAAVMHVAGGTYTVVIPGFGAGAPGLRLRVDDGVCKAARD